MLQKPLPYKAIHATPRAIPPSPFLAARPKIMVTPQCNSAVVVLVLIIEEKGSIYVNNFKKEFT